jgi:multicomponent Na+:H+ antiporter subunit D
MTDLVIPPALILLAGALLIAVTRGWLRNSILWIAPALTLWAIWQIGDGVIVTGSFLGYEIQPVEGSPVRRLFATVFALMALLGGLFAFRQARGYELACAFAYASGAVGVAFAGDLISLFLYWELMAIFSTALVWCGGDKAARAAGIRYAIMHLLGGVILKVGIEGIVVHTGSVEIVPMLANNFDSWMVLIGILINTAAPPVSAWLSDAYPASSPTGSVFLSAFTTKSAVLALILLFPGEGILIWVGLYMIFYGIIYALLENDARRILAYSVVNQVGFMVCAVGIGTETALNGAAAHAFAHIFYKALLFMSAGVVIYRTGKTRCSDLGGLFRTMPVTTVCGIIGALSISSFPFTSGFTTKTLISVAAEEQGLMLVYFGLLAASAGVFLHAGIKFPWFVFFQKDSGMRPKDAPWNMAAAMIICSAVCIGIGIFPEPFWALLPYPVDYDAYAPSKVLFYLQLLLFSGLAFFLLLPMMKRTLTITVDTDWLWRVAGKRLAVAGFALLAATAKRAQLAGEGLRRLSPRVAAVLSSTGSLGSTWQIGTTALWIVVLLTGYVGLYFL